MPKIGEDPELLGAFFRIFTDDNFKTIILAEAKQDNANTQQVREIVQTQVNSKNFYHIWLLTRIILIDAMQKEAEPYLKMYISQVKRDSKAAARKIKTPSKNNSSGAEAAKGEQSGQRPPDFGCWSCGNTDKKHNRKSCNRIRANLTEAQKAAGAEAKKAWEAATATKTPAEEGAETKKK